MKSSLISVPIYCEHMVGRKAELACLLQRFATVENGQGSSIAISGDAGIGKSRLVQAFKESIGDRDAAFLTALCSEHVQAPYLPFERILGEMANSPARRGPRAHPLTAAEEKLRYFSSIAQALRGAAARRPVALVVEDVHWADAASLELIAYLSQHLSHDRVLLIVTFRGDDVARNDELLTLLASLGRTRATHLELRALAPRETQEIIYRALQGRQRISAEARARIEEAAEGNPLFIEELLRGALDDPDGAETYVPVTIRAALRRRIAGLTEEDIEVLRIAAVVGRTFDAALLARLSSHPYQRVLKTLQQACDKQLIVENANQSTFAFRHTLIRQALYGAVIGDVLKSLHARIAHELTATNEDAEKVGELAYHWAAAGDDARAIEYNERAGDRALELSACRDAVRFYRKALEFAYPPGWARAKLYEKLAIALQSEGVSEEPMIWLTAAIAEYRKVGDLVSVASALLAVALQSWFDAKTEEFTAATREAIDLLSSVDAPNLLARARITHARFAITLARIDEAEESLRLAWPETEPLDAGLETELFEVRGEIHGARGDANAALADLERAGRLADRLGSADALMRIENAFAITACDVGEVEAATVAHERALALTTRWALTWRTAYIKVNAAYTAFLAGDLARARTLLLEALASGVDNSTVRVRAAGVGILIGLSMNDEQLVEQLSDRKALDEALLTGEPQRYGLVAAAWSMLLRERGQQDQAREIVGKAMEKLPRFHRCWPLAAEVVAVGDDGAFRRALDLLEAQAASGHAVAKVFLLFARAEAARRNDDRTEGQALARKAAQGFRALHWPIFEAIACEHAGDVDEALAINLRIGNRRDVAKQRGRLHWKAVGGPAGLAAPMLTPRQREIAELIGEGHTNKMIARRLGISEGTVEKHLVTAFERIGVRSRAQLVTYLANTRRSPA